MSPVRMPRRTSLGPDRGSRSSARGLFLVFSFLALFSLSAHAQIPDSTVSESTPPDTPNPSAVQSPPMRPLAGTVTGTVIDGTGATVVGAHLRLSRESHSPSQDSTTGGDGEFSFSNIAPGPYNITVTLDGFAAKTVSGTLQPGETYNIPPIALAVASASTEVKVAFTRTELAEAELKDEEKQRVLGLVPNFYVTYNPSALPLTSKQKFELAWKATIDPINFGITGAIAGIEQADNAFSGYGQGAQGYAKRYGASYANFVASAYIGGAILPSLLKQDPRYFYKGTGTKKSRVLYALANAVICKGDNGRWQPNYSAIIGNLAAGGISNLYYPDSDRQGASLTFENALIGIGATAVSNILQEFVIKKLTPNAPSYAPAQP